MKKRKEENKKEELRIVHLKDLTPELLRRIILDLWNIKTIQYNVESAFEGLIDGKD